MEQLRQTPSQTVGPFFAYALTAEQYGYPYDSLMNHTLVSLDTPGQRIVVTGQVWDGAGATISDAVVELWQADAQGHYRTAPIEGNTATHTDRGFLGFGRVGTGTLPGHRYQFTTLKPGATGEGSAPHINVMLMMRGSLRNLYTRLYFADEPEANAQDILLNAVPAERRATLLAHRKEVNGEIRYIFDIHMQGSDETVFFEL
ncbi:protocatechuate 3,4-dioxygenase subunit alpha [Spirosoma luteum]|uniref:protocatechuate 3,4-dioxygenase subunit alpha n=1 Tax=Spirosoma luteum TaxID=431553 RepID=UPI00036E2C95|nr:protocatechuate 3,4-dioxygenase subunit alpha [Spirosoma luteum]